MTDVSILTSIFWVGSLIVSSLFAIAAVNNAEYMLMERSRALVKVCILSLILSFVCGWLTVSEIYAQTKWSNRQICPEDPAPTPIKPAIIIPPAWKGYDVPKSRPTTA